MIKVAFRKFAPLIKYIIKIDETTTHDAENLDLVMPTYSFLEYISNYSETTGSLWFYSQYEATNFNAANEDNNTFKSFKYKAKLLENSKAHSVNGIFRNLAIAMPLKT